MDALEKQDQATLRECAPAHEVACKAGSRPVPSNLCSPTLPKVNILAFFMLIVNILRPMQFMDALEKQDQAEKHTPIALD